MENQVKLEISFTDVQEAENFSNFLHKNISNISGIQELKSADVSCSKLIWTYKITCSKEIAKKIFNPDKLKYLLVRKNEEHGEISPLGAFRSIEEVESTFTDAELVGTEFKWVELDNMVHFPILGNDYRFKAMGYTSPLNDEFINNKGWKPVITTTKLWGK